MALILVQRTFQGALYPILRTAMILSLAASAACDRAGDSEEPSATTNADDVATLLHTEGLVNDTEVGDSMRASAARYQQAPETREAEAERLHAWIRSWERENPERAAAARAAAARASENATPPSH